MDEMIRGKSTSYARYEELITRRDNLRKEAFQHHRAYVREFGDLILEVFGKKIECIRKKKTIEYCQAALNRGTIVDHRALQDYLAKEMAQFRSQFEDLVKEREATRGDRDITRRDALEIKRIYHRLAKKIHPDINPAVTKSLVIMDLWNRVVISYDCNDLKELRELEVLVNRALQEIDLEAADLDIPDIEDKIAELDAEITKIRETDPYQYKYLLENPDLVAARKAELNEELKSYEDYSKQLEEVLEGILGKGVKITWQMNW